MYGRDWHMLARYDRSGSCFDAMSENWPDPASKARFVGTNALDFLGLRRGQNRDRLEAFYKRKSMAVPKWLEIVKALPA
jgi:hypothetical protein